jgi:hypothetical protein
MYMQGSRKHIEIGGHLGYLPAEKGIWHALTRIHKKDMHAPYLKAKGQFLFEWLINVAGILLPHVRTPL